jgi:hypothetical protein
LFVFECRIGPSHRVCCGVALVIILLYIVNPSSQVSDSGTNNYLKLVPDDDDLAVESRISPAAPSRGCSSHFPAGLTNNDSTSMTRTCRSCPQRWVPKAHTLQESETRQSPFKNEIAGWLNCAVSMSEFGIGASKIPLISFPPGYLRVTTCRF